MHRPNGYSANTGGGTPPPIMNYCTLIFEFDAPVTIWKLGPELLEEVPLIKVGFFPLPGGNVVVVTFEACYGLLLRAYLNG